MKPLRSILVGAFAAIAAGSRAVEDVHNVARATTGAGVFDGKGKKARGRYYNFKNSPAGRVARGIKRNTSGVAGALSWKRLYRFMSGKDKLLLTPNSLPPRRNSRTRRKLAYYAVSNNPVIAADPIFEGQP